MDCSCAGFGVGLLSVHLYSGVFSGPSKTMDSTQFHVLFYIQQYSLLSQSSNIGSEKTYLFPSFSMKSRSVSIRLLRVMVCALPNSYFRTTGMELKRYSPSATARSMAVWAAVRFSVSFMNIGMLVSISWRVRISIISSVTFQTYRSR